MSRFYIKITFIVLALIFILSPHISYSATFGSSDSASYKQNIGINRNLVGWWTFDSTDVAGTKIYDKSGQNNAGDINGGVTRTIGKFGQAVALDGTTGYITGTNSTDIASTPITVSAWVKFLGTPGNNYPRIIDLQDGNYSAQIVWDHGGGGSDQLVTKHSEWQTASNGTQWGLTPALNTWYHLVAIWDASSNSTRFYINGTEKTGSANSNVGEAVARNKYFVGVRGDLLSSPNTFGNEIVDDVRIYSRALAPSEVKQLYARGSSAVVGSNMLSGKSYVTDGLKSGLVGYWTFDAADIAGAAVYDKSGQNNTGSKSASLIPAIGKLGQAIGPFTGQNYINVGNSSTLNPPIITITAWIKATAAAVNNNNIITRGSNDYIFETYNNGANDKMLFMFDGYNAYYNNTGMARNRWHFVAVSYDPTLAINNIKFYADGVLDGTSTTSSPMFITSNDNLIGARGGNVANFFLDDVRVYNRALSLSEIKQLYQMGASAVVGSNLTSGKSYATGGLNSGLVGHWTFDATDVAGTQVYDKSGRNNNGTSSGGLTRAVGKLGQAYKFDGTSGKIQSSTVTGWSNTAISIAFWAKQLAAPANYAQVVGDLTSCGAVYVFPSSGQFFGQLSLTTAGGAITGYVAPGTGWNYWVFTWQSGDKLKLYRNGALAVQSGSAYTDTIVNFSGFSIGYYGSGPDYFNGYVDDARVYNRALSPSEVIQLYQLGK